MADTDARELVEIAKLPVFYAGALQISSSPFDFVFRFGISHRTAGGRAEEWQVQVIQSPPMAKVFLKLLQEQIEAYERNIGPIPDVATSVVKEPGAGA